MTSIAAAPARPPELTVTVMIPMRNEEAMIEACLASVLANALPDGVTSEILVLDGESSDRSVELVRALAKGDARIRVIDNPRRLQSAAFNLALAEARGTFFVRLDAHSLYPADYIASCLRLLEETGAENVGGVVLARGSTPMGEAIAAAVGSKFAVGDAQYRVATKPGWVDTIFPGAWRTATLRRLGGMREDLLVNEDYELNTRLRQAGGKIWLDPSIRPVYFVRGTLRSLARQYGRYGFWKVRSLRDHPGSLRWRQVVAPAFVLSILLTPLSVALLGSPLGWCHLIAYAAANLTASFLTARKHGAGLFLRLPLIFLIVHVAWGGGFLLGLGYWPFRPKTPA